MKLLLHLMVLVVVFFAGYVVVRYTCKRKEQHRQRMFEKALDAAATSPYCRHVDKWVLAGAAPASLYCEFHVTQKQAV